MQINNFLLFFLIFFFYDSFTVYSFFKKSKKSDKKQAPEEKEASGKKSSKFSAKLRSILLPFRNGVELGFKKKKEKTAFICTRQNIEKRLKKFGFSNKLRPETEAQPVIDYHNNLKIIGGVENLDHKEVIPLSAVENAPDVKSSDPTEHFSMIMILDIDSSKGTTLIMLQDNKNICTSNCNVSYLPSDVPFGGGPHCWVVLGFPFDPKNKIKSTKQLDNIKKNDNSIESRNNFNLKDFVKTNKKYFSQRKKKTFTTIGWTPFQVENLGNTSEGNVMHNVGLSPETKNEMLQNGAAESSQIDNVS